MIINNIKKLTKGRYKISFNNDFLIVYEDILIKYNLLTNKNIDNKIISKIKKDNDYYEIYNTAIRYISIRMRSKKEVFNYLILKFKDDKNVNKVIEIITKERYIDDVKFCKSFVNDKLYLSNDGIDKIKRSLLNYEVDEKTINEIIDEIDLNTIKDKLYKLMDKYININKKYSKNQLKNKIIYYFINNGYSKDMILDVYEMFNIKENNDAIKTEYDKLLQKYSKKYSSYKLDSFIKSKLYQKGFSVEEINNIME
jgi:regulatory protein